VDLFGGGGALTVGLKRAGFNVVATVENNQAAFDTYKTNHPDVHGYLQDICGVSGADLAALSPSGHIDLVAGCPPCQGFSSLTRKYRRQDPRNMLIRQMTRIVRELEPQAVMLENVPGLETEGRSLFNEFIDMLWGLGYLMRWGVLQVADYGVPQSRRRLVIVAGKGFVINLPAPTHSNRQSDGRREWRTVRDAIGQMPEPVTMQRALAAGGPSHFDWHVVRTLHPRNEERLRHAVPGASWHTIPREHRTACHQDATGHYFSNVYGRMQWDQVAPTITGGCTTLSKGRFGHPIDLRTISVREAAMLQTLPPDYLIATDQMEHACDIVGNALPCDFAEAVAHECYKAISHS
jgi:DNA (cytosine-5)-methyltransferase 1